MITDADLARRLGYPAAGRNKDGAVVALVPLTAGRGRLVRGDETGVNEFW